MDGIAASVIAVLGTLLGAGLTQLFQQRGTIRAEALARDERLRQERLDAYCGYAAALVSYRWSLVHVWFCEHEERREDELPQAWLRSYDLRSAAQEALFRVQMLSGEAGVVRRAWEVLDRIGDLHLSGDRAELDRRRADTRDLINDFVTAAQPSVVPSPLQ